MGVRIGGGHDEEDDDCSPEMWYSVTPESIANHIAQRMMNIILYQKKLKGSIISESREQQKNIIILDLFCGCGGNSIAFARYNNNNNNAVNVRTNDETDNHDTACPAPHVMVVAVDNNLSRLKNAAHNASIYDVDCRDIVFVHADAIDVLCQYSRGNLKSRDNDVYKCNSSSSSDKTEYGNWKGFNIGGTELLPNNIDGIFLSPPWGGMDYENIDFDVVASITVESITSEEQGASNTTKMATTVITNGGELLSLATKAVFNDRVEHNRDGVVAYFLPRNIDGIALGLTAVASDVVGSFEMEQNVVSGKCKTVTAYFGRGVEETLV
jgi:trimethylguanosine synthase